jgi:hypothetical protein
LASIGRHVQFVRSGLPLRPLGELLVALPGEDARLDPTDAPEPPVGGGDTVHEEVLELADGLQLGPQVLAEFPNYVRSSPGRRTSSESRPCLRAFRRMTLFPSGFSARCSAWRSGDWPRSSCRSSLRLLAAGRIVDYEWIVRSQLVIARQPEFRSRVRLRGELLLGLHDEGWVARDVALGNGGALGDRAEAVRVPVQAERDAGGRSPGARRSASPGLRLRSSLFLWSWASLGLWRSTSRRLRSSRRRFSSSNASAISMTVSGSRSKAASRGPRTRQRRGPLSGLDPQIWQCYLKLIMSLH